MSRRWQVCSAPSSGPRVCEVSTGESFQTFSKSLRPLASATSSMRMSANYSASRCPDSSLAPAFRLVDHCTSSRQSFASDFIRQSVELSRLVGHSSCPDWSFNQDEPIVFVDSHSWFLIGQSFKIYSVVIGQSFKIVSVLSYWPIAVCHLMEMLIEMIRLIRNVLINPSLTNLIGPWLERFLLAVHSEYSDW